MDHKITIQRVNFVTPITIVTSPAKVPFAIETPFAPQQQRKIETLHPVVCKNHYVFFIFVLTLTPANSMEISNKHLVSRYTVKFNELSDDPITLFDTGVTGETFMDKKYAQQQGIPSIF